MYIFPERRFPERDRIFRQVSCEYIITVWMVAVQDDGIPGRTGMDQVAGLCIDGDDGLPDIGGLSFREAAPGGFRFRVDAECIGLFRRLWNGLHRYREALACHQQERKDAERGIFHGQMVRVNVSSPSQSRIRTWIRVAV